MSSYDLNHIHKPCVVPKQKCMEIFKKKKKSLIIYHNSKHFDSFFSYFFIEPNRKRNQLRNLAQSSNQPNLTLTYTKISSHDLNHIHKLCVVPKQKCMKIFNKKKKKYLIIYHNSKHFDSFFSYFFIEPNEINQEI